MIGTRLAQRYELLRELGRGGMGVVYLARDPHLDREVAIKVLSVTDLGEAAEERFLREAQIVARMDHPSIVPIYDLGQDEDRLFFVMPVVHGRTLLDLNKNSSLALGDILEISAQVAEALDYSHQRSVVHRDIKPENVMVAREDDHPRARVMDFGLALGDAVSRLTKTGNLPGTLGYLSPEQILATAVDGRSDLYSLGTILYECLVGKPPFAGSRYALLYQIVNEDPPSLAAYGIDPRLELVVLRCLAKNPGDRPARGNDLAAQLRRHAETLTQSGLASEVGLSPVEAYLPARSGTVPLVGRDRELGELRFRLERAAGAECQLVLIGGEPGLGKTRLLEELEHLARARGFRVLRGQFSDQESAFPFQAFGELIQDFYLSKEIASSSASALPDLSDLEDDLQILFPALSELKMLGMPRDGERSSGAHSAGSSSRISSAWVPSTWEAPEEPAQADAPLGARTGFAVAAARRGDPTHLFEILARTLTRLAGGKPTVYLLEHLHGAGISVDALQYIVRRLGPTPSLFAGTYRPSEAPRGHSLTRLVKGVRDEPRFSSIMLEPLNASELRKLLASRLGAGELSNDLEEKVFEATEGNPFFALELVRSLVDAGEVSRDSSGFWVLSEEAAILPGSLPETIQQAVEARLEQLPEELLETLRMASVLGRSFDYRDLEVLVGEDVDEAVEKLLREGLLHEDHQARSELVHFSSGVVRDVLLGDLSRRRRRMLHRRHARNLEQRYSGKLERVYPQLVDHFAAGDVAVKTIEYALRLARKSIDAVSANVAIGALKTALDFVEDEEIDPATEGELRFLLASALRSAGSTEGAVKEAARAVRVFRRTGRPESAAGAALLAAETSWQARRVGETTRWVDRGIDLARSANAGEPLRKLLTLGATVANLRGEYQKARLRWEEAQDLVAVSQPVDEPLPRGGVLTASMPVELSFLDPRHALTIEEKEVLANIFEPLIEADAEGNLVPCLCEDWEKSPDNRHFLLRLRREACFSDGSPLGADDVRRSLASAERRRLPPACAALDGAAEHFESGSIDWPGIETVDEHTLRFHLGESLPIFPILLSDLRAAIHRVGENGQLLGTGPFCLESHRRDTARLVRNAHYWRGRPPLLDGLEFRTFRDSAAAAADLRSGELDVGRDFRPDELDHLLRDSRFRSGLVEATRQNVYLVALNRTGPKTRDPELRRALVDVIRVQDAVWQTLGRFAQPASCLIPPEVLGHEPGRRRTHLTEEKARELLEKAGFELPVELRAVAHPLFFDRYRSFKETLLKWWESLGVRVVFENDDRPGYLEKTADATGVDLWIGRWVADYHDPDSFTLGLLHSREGFVGSFVGSEKIDEIIVKARHAERVGARQILYHKLESLLSKDRALLPLFYDVDYRLVSPRVRGLKLVGRLPYVNYSEVARLDDPATLDGLTPAEPDRDSGVVHVPLPAVTGDLSPRQGQVLGNAEMIGTVFETLTRLDEGARIVPCLASEFRLEEGGRRFRFKLRSNVRFHDGRQLTVRDVRYTFEELIRGLGDEAFQAELVPIRGGRGFWEGETSELEGFKILSANEFVIELERPLSFFPAMLTSTSTAIVPEGTRRFDGNWRDGTAGTGPFRVLRFDAERLELEAHPHYWRRGLPKCDRLVFELGVEPGRIAEELRAGRLALGSFLRPAEVDELLLATEFGAEYCEMPGFSTCCLILDTRRGPLADAKVRDAFRQVIGDADLVRPTLGRLAAPAHGLIPPGLLGHEPRHRKAAVEPEGRPSGVEALAGLELRTAVYPVYLGPYAPFWDALAQLLESAGARLEVIEATPVETLWRISRSEIDLAAVRWSASYPDPDTLIHFFHSHGYLGRLMGRSEIDELFDRGRNETDPALRHTLYRQIDRILGRHDAVVPLFHEQVYRVAHPELRGLRLRFGWPEVAYEELSLVD